MMNRFHLELRVLIDEPMEGMMRGQILELDLSLIAALDDPVTKLLTTLQGAALLMVRSGNAQFRLGEQIPAGLLLAFGDAVADEDCAESAGVVYRGALGRWVHVETEIQNTQPAKLS